MIPDPWRFRLDNIWFERLGTGYPLNLNGADLEFGLFRTRIDRVFGNLVDHTVFMLIVPVGEHHSFNRAFIDFCWKHVDASS